MSLLRGLLLKQPTRLVLLDAQAICDFLETRSLRAHKLIVADHPRDVQHAA